MHLHFPASPPRQWQRQTGGVLIQFAIMLTLLVGMLAVIDIGYLYYAKRDLQRLADLAALEATESLVWGDAGSCSAAEAAGQRSVDAQWPIALEKKLQRIECGNWELDNWHPTLGTRFTTSGAPINAARVTLAGAAPRFIPFNWTGDDPERKVSASATGAKTQDPIAAFSIGSGVARLNEGALNTLLSALLGTNVDLSLIDYEGLANANIDLLGLQDALDLRLGTYEELANARVSLDELLDVALSAIENQPESPTVDLALGALSYILQLPVDLGDIFINLLKTENGAGLLDLGLYADNPASALAADFNALNLLLVGLQVANAESGIALEMEVPLEPLATVDLKVRIIEPPVIAVGPPGYEGGVPRTSAHTGQVRVLANIQALTAAGGNNNLLDLNLLVARVRLGAPAGQLINLPLYLEVGSADGILDNIACRHQGRSHQVGIDVRPGLAHVFLGYIPEDAFNNTSTTWEHLPKEHFSLLSLKLQADLLFGLIPVATAPISLNARLALDIEHPEQERVHFLYDDSKDRTEQELIATVGSQKKLGQSISNAIFNDRLLEVELDISKLELLDLSLDVLNAIVGGLLEGVMTILNGVLLLLGGLLRPVLALLDGLVLGPLLEQLGLQLGAADVELLSATCDTAQLVE